MANCIERMYRDIKFCDMLAKDGEDQLDRSCEK
jgi:hypothetical protein